MLLEELAHCLGSIQNPFQEDLKPHCLICRIFFMPSKLFETISSLKGLERSHGLFVLFASCRPECLPHGTGFGAASFLPVASPGRDGKCARSSWPSRTAGIACCGPEPASRARPLGSRMNDIARPRPGSQSTPWLPAENVNACQ